MIKFGEYLRHHVNEDGDFKESDHPRDSEGKFTETDSSSVKKVLNDRYADKVKKYVDDNIGSD